MDLWYFYCTLCILKNDIKCHYTIITVMTSKHLIIFTCVLSSFTYASTRFRNFRGSKNNNRPYQNSMEYINHPEYYGDSSYENGLRSYNSGQKLRENDLFNTMIIGGSNYNSRERRYYNSKESGEPIYISVEYGGSRESVGSSYKSGEHGESWSKESGGSSYKSSGEHGGSWSGESGGSSYKSGEHGEHGEHGGSWSKENYESGVNGESWSGGESGGSSYKSGESGETWSARNVIENSKEFIISYSYEENGDSISSEEIGGSNENTGEFKCGKIFF